MTSLTKGRQIFVVTMLCMARGIPLQKLYHNVSATLELQFGAVFGPEMGIGIHQWMDQVGKLLSTLGLHFGIAPVLMRNAVIQSLPAAESIGPYKRA